MIGTRVVKQIGGFRKKSRLSGGSAHSNSPKPFGLVCVRIVVTRLQDAMGGFPVALTRTRLVTSYLRTSLSGTRPPLDTCA